MTLDQIGFECSQQDLQIANFEDPCGVDGELRDHMQATLQSAASMLNGVTIETVDVTPEGATCSNAPDPQPLSLKLRLSNGKILLLMGGWRARLYEPMPAAVVA